MKYVIPSSDAEFHCQLTGAVLDVLARNDGTLEFYVEQDDERTKYNEEFRMLETGELVPPGFHHFRSVVGVDNSVRHIYVYVGEEWTAASISDGDAQSVENQESPLS